MLLIYVALVLVVYCQSKGEKKDGAKDGADDDE